MTSKQAIDMIKQVLGLKSENFYEGKTEQGIPVSIEGDLAVGSKVYVSTEEGMIPAPPGVHKLDDGSQIEVDEEGSITKIKMGEMETEDEEIEKEKEEEDIADENMSEVELEFGDVKLVDGTVLRMEGEGEIVGRRLKKVGYDGTLSAIADGQYETVGGQVLQIVGGAIEGVQSVADNAKRKTGFADYPWDQCMEDQMKQYGDEEIAKKVCGAIKAGNMSEGFAVAKEKGGLLLTAPKFEMGDMVEVIKDDGTKVRAKDQGYDIKIGEKEMTIMVTDGKISDIMEVRKGEGPEDINMSQIEAIANVFADAFKKLETRLDEISSKQSALEGKFQKFSKEPAGERVYTQKTINEESIPQHNEKLEAFRRLRNVMAQN